MITLEKTLHGEDLFSELDPEEKQDQRKIAITKSKVDEIWEKYEKYCSMKRRTTFLDDTNFQLAKKIIRGKRWPFSSRYNKSDIEGFLIQYLSRYNKDENAEFISALIDMSPDKNFKIRIPNDEQLKIGLYIINRRIT